MRVCVRVCVCVCVCVCVHVAAPLCVPVFTPCVLQEVDKMKRGFEEQMTKMRGEVSKIQEEKVRACCLWVECSWLAGVHGVCA